MAIIYGNVFDLQQNNGMLRLLDEAILMSTHNIQFRNKISTFPSMFVFLSYRKKSVGTQNWVRISHGKWAIGVWAIEVQTVGIEILSETHSVTHASNINWRRSFDSDDTLCTKKKNKVVREKSRECHNHKPQPFPDTRRGNRQSSNRTNVRKALKLALSSPSEVIAMLKGMKNIRTK